MKKLALVQLLSLALAALLVQVVDPAAAQTAPKPSAACNPWSANYWGDAVIRSQADADEYACFRRIVGTVTILQSSRAPFVLPKLQGIVGSVRIAFPRREQLEGAAAELAQMLPALREVNGDLEVEYAAAGRDVRAALDAFGLESVAVRGNLRLAVVRAPRGASTGPKAISDASARR